MFGQTSHRPINALLNERLEARRPLIAVHRGTGSGMIVENTAPAVAAALRSGADMVEIDVIASTDGDYFVFHDGYENAHFGLDRNLQELSTEEIEALSYRQRSDEPVRVERLETVLRSFPGVLFNIDRSWRYWQHLLGWFDRFDMAEQLILKSPPEPSALEFLRRHPVKYPFVVIVSTEAELDAVASDPLINLVGAELIAADESHPFCDPEWVTELRQRGIFAYVNALDLGNGRALMAGWDDTRSVLDDADEGWGRLVELGADVIQTDWPALLSGYLGSRTDRAVARTS
ncbi:glycerophosphodiester phosphodiesterase family protein [Cryobacterium sp. SO1]|uniref:glycerophosphodiester phosphodiesterase family protein n=1 Tax=Cryobacterium sp. SO1 TaxID=1897061 RepID=UPI001022C5A5|nr:glycerophosphodiester phosphodiesterase family protein [Cryobacterium sp. SO1]RZI37206.1 hypothetical protein BJQ95_00373 [Cryobacterium sp. SO1]